jgi:hypothetical protein
MAKKFSTSPKGRLVYPHLHTPDTKFKTAGEYKTDLVVPASDLSAQNLIAAIDAAMAASLATARAEAATPAKAKKVKNNEDPPYFLQEDDEGNETGNIIFRFKLNANGKTKMGEVFTQRPALFDAFGRPLSAEDAAKIGSGSLARCSYEFSEFYTVKLGAGVTMRLKAVQIIELVEWGGGDASYYGFEDETDGEADAEDDDDEEEEEVAPLPVVEDDDDEEEEEF